MIEMSVKIYQRTIKYQLAKCGKYLLQSTISNAVAGSARIEISAKTTSTMLAAAYKINREGIAKQDPAQHANSQEGHPESKLYIVPTHITITKVAITGEITIMIEDVLQLSLSPGVGKTEFQAKR